MREFGTRLAKLRNDKSLSVKEVAAKASIPLSSYREWEQGRKILGEPYPDLASALGITLGELFGLESIEHKEVITSLEEVKYTLYRLEQIIKRSL